MKCLFLKFKSILLLPVSLASFLSCQPKQVDVKDYLDGWEYITTYKSIPLSAIVIEDKRSKVISGINNVLIVELERKPIFKLGEELTDLYSIRTLLIEINPDDSVITPAKLGKSRILRGIYSMSPSYGVNSLAGDEDIQIRKRGLKQWSIVSNLSDFKFEGKFSFLDSATIVNKHQEFY